VSQTACVCVANEQKAKLSELSLEKKRKEKKKQ
jgi:hypothetical protein